MMRIRTECVKYGTVKPKRIWSHYGPPIYDITKTVLQMFLKNRCTIAYISNFLSVSESTVYRRRHSLDYSDISDDHIDLKEGKTFEEFPLCEENLLRQMITLKGIRVPRWRLRDSIHRMDAHGVSERKAGRLHRRVYDVTGPNHL